MAICKAKGNAANRKSGGLCWFPDCSKYARCEYSGLSGAEKPGYDIPGSPERL